MADSPLTFYATPGPMTDPKQYGYLFDDLPGDVPALCQVVQGLMVHVFWAERYGIVLSDARKGEVGLRAVGEKLARILELDPRPLTAPRPLANKLVGNCRDHSVLLVAMLRHQGIPARARCGFGTYFLPDHFEDHWVVEYWNAAQACWVMVDPQLDELQRNVLGIGFDTTDMPAGQFVVGGRAWQMCRVEGADPDKFGIFDMHGLWFVRGNHVRDVAALNKVELLPWDCWGFMDVEEKASSPQGLALLDRAAELALGGNERFDALRALYLGQEDLRVPPVIRSYGAAGPQNVALPELDSVVVR